MRSLQDIVYNYMTIKVVLDQDENDTAAIETCSFFSEVMKEQHDATFIKYELIDERYIVSVLVNGVEKQFIYPQEMIDYMLDFANESKNVNCKFE